jgi:methionyl-tRNA formyltransferase
MRILFAGTGDIGVPTLRYLVQGHDLVGILTQPDRPVGRHREIKPPVIKEEMLRIAPTVPLLQPESLRFPGILPWVCGLRPEVIVTMAYGNILPREILEAPELACLNLHASLLPRHRGASPIQASIASGETESGITIIYMAEGLDTGDILLEKKLLLHRRETAGSLSARLAELAPVALAEALSLLAGGIAPRIPQDHGRATVCGKIRREECLIDWSRPARELERKIRSLQPRPAAVAPLPLSSGGSILIKIHSAILAKHASGIPGTILRADSRGILVACGDGGLILGKIQPEGRGVMHSSAFARGYDLVIQTPLA